jgi:hypothetical protein
MRVPSVGHHFASVQKLDVLVRRAVADAYVKVPGHHHPRGGPTELLGQSQKQRTESDAAPAAAREHTGQEDEVERLIFDFALEAQATEDQLRYGTDFAEVSAPDDCDTRHFAEMQQLGSRLFGVGNAGPTRALRCSQQRAHDRLLFRAVAAACGGREEQQQRSALHGFLCGSQSSQ